MRLVFDQEKCFDKLNSPVYTEKSQFSDTVGTSISHAEDVTEEGVNAESVNDGVYDFVSPEKSTPTKLPHKRKSLDKTGRTTAVFYTSEKIDTRLQDVGPENTNFNGVFISLV